MRHFGRLGRRFWPLRVGRCVRTSGKQLSKRRVVNAQGFLSMVRKRRNKFLALNKALNVYRREADKCEQCRAFLAGCMLQGALLEACLTLMALVYREEVSKTNAFQAVKKRVEKNWKRHVRWLRDFDPRDLEKIAIELSWCSGLEHELKSLRDVRNLIHPGKYADEIGKRKAVNNRYYQSQYKRLLRITDKLYDKLIQSLTIAWREGRL